MAFETLATKAKYYRYEELQPGTVICEGWFVETGKSKYGRTVYFVHDSAGNVHGLNGAGHLDYCFKAITPEDYIRVTYMGKDKLTKGKNIGTDAHTFRMEIDKSRKGKRTISGFTEVADAQPEEAEEAFLL